MSIISIDLAGKVLSKLFAIIVDSFIEKTTMLVLYYIIEILN